MLNKMYHTSYSKSINIGKNPNSSFLRKALFLPIIIIVLFCTSFISNISVSAASTNYGIMIGDANGNYSFYDFNSSSIGLELSDTGKAMLSAWKFANKVPVIKYSYDKSTGKAVLKNTHNGKKIVFTKNSVSCEFYKSSTAKPVTKELTTPMYISKDTASVMVPAAAISWLMPSGGYQFLSTSTMQDKAYDTFSYSGCFVYQPYQKITSIPSATQVAGISNTVRVTIPEGYSVSQIFDLLVKKGVCTSTELLYTACNSYDFSYYSLVGEIIPNENRCFRLEGYLYPDTYEFYRNSSGQDAIGKFLRNAEQKITEKDRDRAAELGFTMDEILTIASIIEKECGVYSEQASVSAVIHNRLSIGKKLEMDAGSFYVERYIKPFITGDINRYNSYYNTYKCEALPAGPICNPGRKAIEAALNPSDISALYFYSDINGVYHYAATFEEHQANIAAAKSAQQQAEVTP